MCNPPKRCVSFPEILKTLLPHKSPDLFFHQISICVIDGLCMKLCLCVSTIIKQTSSNHTVPGMCVVFKHGRFLLTPAKSCGIYGANVLEQVQRPILSAPFDSTTLTDKANSHTQYSHIFVHTHTLCIC